MAAAASRAAVWKRSRTCLTRSGVSGVRTGASMVLMDSFEVWGLRLTLRLRLVEIGEKAEHEEMMIAAMAYPLAKSLGPTMIVD